MASFLPTFERHNENVDTFEEIEETIDENKRFTEEKQQSLLTTFRQSMGRIIVIFAAYLPMNGATKEQYVHYLFIFIMIVGVAYMIKTWLELKAKAFYESVGHYAHGIALDACSFIFEFFIVGIFGLIRSRGEYTIEDLPYAVFLLTFINLTISAWSRHIKNKRFVPNFPQKKKENGHRFVFGSSSASGGFPTTTP
jgi:hypothetical protein